MSLPDFKSMTLNERMDWLSKASAEAQRELAKYANSHDKDLVRFIKSIGYADEKPQDNSPLSKVAIRLMPKVAIRNTDGIRMRSSSDKVARFMRRTGDNFSDYHDADYSESPRDPAWKANAPKVAKARPDSPFKRSGKAASAVVIVRK